MPIKQAWFNLTRQCNNECIWCYAGQKDKENPRVSQEVSFANGKKTLSFLRDIGVENCILVGGEPTLHPDLFGMLDYAAQINLRLSIVTNGRRLSDISYVKSLEEHKIIVAPGNWTMK